MAKLSIVSADGHAVMPPELWSEDLEPECHEHLPQFEAENAVNTKAMYPPNDMLMVPAMEQIDRDGAYHEGRWAGVPEADVGKILDENAIRFFGLDAAAVAAVAERVGPSVDDITSSSAVEPDLIAHSGDRTGYLEPAEGATHLAEIADMLQQDLDRVESVAR